MKDELPFGGIRKVSNKIIDGVADLLAENNISHLHPKDQVFIHMKIAVASLSFSYAMLFLCLTDRKKAEEAVRGLKKNIDEEVERIINLQLKELDDEDQKGN